MKRNYWSVFLLNSSPSTPVKKFRVPEPAVILFYLFFLAGLVGFIRVAGFTAAYSYARFGVDQERKKSERLIKTVDALCRLMRKNTKEADQLVHFENNTRLKYGLNAISDDFRKAGVGGKPDAEELLLASLKAPSVGMADSVKEKIFELLRQTELQNGTFSQVVNHVQRLHEQWSWRPSIWPVLGLGRITSSFGRRTHPFTGYRTFHEGLDIANTPWTAIIAPADGIVTHVLRKPYYGNMIIINHHNIGYTTRYAHLAESVVGVGRPVKRGELIGYMGSSGRSTGTHLHYEVRKHGKPVNPIDFILPINEIID